MYLRRILGWSIFLCLAPALIGQQSAPKYPPPAEVKAAFLKLLDRPRGAARSARSSARRPRTALPRNT